MGHEVTRAGSVPQVHSVVGEGKGHWNGDGSVARGGGAEWRGGEDQGRVVLPKVEMTAAARFGF